MVDYDTDLFDHLVELASVLRDPDPEAVSDVETEPASLDDVAAAVERLAAGGLIETDEDGRVVTLLAPHAELISRILAARLLVVVEKMSDNARDRRRYYVGSRTTIERVSLDGTERLVAVESASALERLFEFVGLEPAEAGTRPPFSLDANLLQGLRSPHEPSSAAPLLDLDNALRRGSTFVRVTTVYRSGEGVEGGEVAWVDPLEGGLWALDMAGAAEGASSFPSAAVSSFEVGERILSYLPGRP